MIEQTKTEAFETFAQLHPHEAAEQDWQAFLTYIKKKFPNVREEEIRQVLAETQGE